MRDADPQSVTISRLYEREEFHERISRAIDAISASQQPDRSEAARVAYRELIPSREMWACARCGRLHIQTSPTENAWRCWIAHEG